jgi:plastocyanin
MRRRIAILFAGVPLVLLIGWAVAGTAVAGGGCHGAPESEARPSEASAAVVKIDGCTFAPTVARVAAGTEVRFINASQAFHDIVGRDRAWGTEALDVGREFRHTFQDEGLYPFSCSLHPGMAGVIVVGGPAVAEAPDLQAAAAVAPADAAPADDGSVTGSLAAGALGLIGGLLVGALWMRFIRRRADAA